ncbi:MAG: NAD(P)H-hydrate dehydratase, partial [Geodermatophilaceae bacterium]|nr:NAD(P)H-hydrate dehydratase [Geodermatophilaceae bacterium]
GAGVAHSGAVHLVDIGLGRYLDHPVAKLLEPADVAALLPVPRPGDDKYRRGVLGVVSGSAAYEGAAVLSVGGALRGKAGMVRYAGSAADGVRARWPEAVVTTTRPAEAGRVQAWVIGPGLGTDQHARGLVAEVLSTDVPVVVDADALTLVASEPQLVRSRTAPTVLTPHDREFERIFGPLGDDRLGGARRAATDFGATVLLKGQATIVADPTGRVFVNPTGSGWLATAGTGDVLAGLTGAFLAAGGDSTSAAAVAAYVHGVAGALAAGARDPVSTATGAPIVAMDVVAAIPGAIRSVSGMDRERSVDRRTRTRLD